MSRHSVSQEQAGFSPPGPTIGVLLQDVTDSRFHAAWTGIVATARQHQANVLTLPLRLLDPSVITHPPAFPAPYDLLSPCNVDGIITFQWWSSQEHCAAICQRYHPLPIINIMRCYDGFPGIMPDNAQGMRVLLTHLIDTHGYRRIAYVRGASKNISEHERYRIYTEVLAEHNLPLDPTLISDHIRLDVAETFDAAVETLLDHTFRAGKPVDAMVAYNDVTAYRLIERLNQHGFRVPGDVAVVGFDNEAYAGLTKPPLTTIEVSWKALGCQATELLLSRLRGEPIPDRTLLPLPLVVRRSCGCLNPDVVQADVRTDRGMFQADPLRCSVAVPDIAAALEQAARPAWMMSDNWATRLAAACVETLSADPQASSSSSAFLETLETVLYQAEHGGGDPGVGQNVLSTLARLLWPVLSPDVQAQQRWGALFQQGRVLTNLISQWAYARQQAEKETQADRLRTLSQHLISTFDIGRMTDILAADLPSLGIRRGYLALYDRPDALTEGARLILAYDEQGRHPLPAAGQPFPSRQIIPPDLYPHDHAWVMVVEALQFGDEQLGFMACEVEPSQGPMCDILRGEISSALQGALLVQRVQERTAEITRQKYILDTFMANVPDSIYFKDRDSRITHANQAHAKAMGLRDPAEEIGKTDFDFFPAAYARPKYDEEQAILRTGQPLLALEEPDAGGRWSLTTKMPLRDEHGAIIGTFGISRDITELKKAQQALQQAYSEISVLNTQLQVENVRMSAELHVVKQLQQMILPRPQELANIPGLDIVGYMQPADEVGGDYYDVLRHEGVLHIGIGDVTGHGLESGVLMLMTQAAIRTLIEHGETDPVKFVNTLNRLIYKNIERMGTDKNLTFALVQYQGGQFKLVGQHEELLVVRQNGQVERIETMNLGFPVGLEPEIADWVHAATVTLAPGDGLVLYTDGITEAENADKELYGITRLCTVLSQRWNQSAEAIKQAVVEDVMAHIGSHKVYDDITLVVLKQC